MRITQETGLLGEQIGTSITLTKAEKAAMARASAIAAQARELARKIDPDFEDHDTDMVLAEIEHGAHDLTEWARIEIR